MSVATTDLAQLTINTIRTLAMDAVQKANSGHAGTPMALAPVAYSIWRDVLRYDPDVPDWPGRDRFVLSCGHASMLLYAVLHLAGVKQLDLNGRPTGELAVPLDQIKQFRQLHSRCPGHPEHGETTGVETTTGPLGQGAGNSVGMAIAGRWLAARYNRPGFDLFDYNVYTLASDGDMMEGVTSEAASLAGHLRLSNLCWIYDDNRITIEGSTSLAFSEDVGARFAAYGWRVEHVDDANDLRALSAALERFRAAKTGPTLIVVRSHIAYGAPHAQDTNEAHGAPLGEDEIRATKQAYGWPADAHFLVPEEARQNFAQPIAERGAKLRTAWEELRRRYAREFPAESAQLDLIARGELPKGWDSGIPSFPADAKGTATRNSSGKVLGAVAEKIPWFLGGSADLAPSTKTLLSFDGAGTLAAETHGGRNMHFGIREHGMGAVLNGMALSGLRPYGATFLVFSDYMRGSIRLASIMNLGVLYVFTHDSIGVGEDGPTHQPIEHYAALRAIPHLVVIRPGDANEVAEAYRSALSLRQPTALLLSRQNVPTLDRSKYASASGAARGAYVMADAKGGAPQVILIGTGTELYLCVDAFEQLSAAGVRARLVSMPSWELFEAQSETYRNEVFPTEVTARVAVEVGVRQGWDRYIGRKGRYVGLDDFGASAPSEEIYAERGITVERIVAEARAAANEG